MSTTETTDTADTAGAAKTDTWLDRVPRAPKPEQTPWHKPEDAKGWTTIHRGEGRPRPPVAARLAVSLTAEQMAWVERQAEAAGLDVFAFMAKLVDDARAAEARAQAKLAKQTKQAKK